MALEDLHHNFLTAKLEDVVKASETGALGAGTSSPEVRANKPPVVQIDELTGRTFKVGQPVTLVAHVADDGIPKGSRSIRHAS